MSRNGAAHKVNITGAKQASIAKLIKESRSQTYVMSSNIPASREYPIAPRKSVVAKPLCAFIDPYLTDSIGSVKKMPIASSRLASDKPSASPERSAQVTCKD